MADALAGALALAVLSGVIAWSLKPAVSLPFRRLEMPMPARVLHYGISPDASRLAYISEGRLYVRRFDDSIRGISAAFT